MCHVCLTYKRTEYFLHNNIMPYKETFMYLYKAFLVICFILKVDFLMSPFLFPDPVDNTSYKHL